MLFLLTSWYLSGLSESFCPVFLLDSWPACSLAALIGAFQLGLFLLFSFHPESSLHQSVEVENRI